MISIIAAIGDNNELGKNNGLIWNLPSDLKFFKKITINHPVIMGKNTYLSIGRALPNRYNILVSKSIKEAEGFEIVDNFENIVDRFLNSPEEVFIIGGSSLYNYFLPCADKLYLTRIHETEECDVYFPMFNENDYDIKLIDKGEENNISFEHILYTKKK